MNYHLLSISPKKPVFNKYFIATELTFVLGSFHQSLFFALKQTTPSQSRTVSNPIPYLLSSLLRSLSANSLPATAQSATQSLLSILSLSRSDPLVS